MLITCWSVKGGSGTTIVAVALALLAAERSEDTCVVDLAGDVPAALGMAEPAGPGINEWLSAPASVGADALDRLAVPASPGLRVVPSGPSGPRAEGPARRWAALADTLAADARTFVVDAGTGEPPRPLREASTHDLLVVRGCYLTLRRAALLERRPTGVVLVAEPARSLKRPDVEHVTGAPVVAEIDWDPNVARAVDAGLLAGRVPKSLRGPLGVVPCLR